MIYLIKNELFEHEKFKISTVEDCIAYLENFDEINIDSETEGFDPHTCNILVLQLGAADREYIIDVTTVDIKLFKSLIENKCIKGHNLKFDLKFLYHQGIYPTKVYDTFLAECVLTTGYEREESKLGLKDVALKYCNKILNKDIRGVIHREGLTTRVIQYCAEDIQFLDEIKEKQLTEINKLGLLNVLNLENDVVKVFAKMEYDGVLIDKDKWLEVAEATEANLSNSQLVLDNIVLNEPKLKNFVPNVIQGNLFGFEERLLHINWSSNQQKLEILQTLGINVNSVDEYIKKIEELLK